MAPKYRNNAMRIAGIVLTSVASAALFSGVAFASIVHGADVTLIIAMPLIGASTVLAGIGIPLWVVGGRPGAPAVSIGPGSVRITF